MNLHVRIEQRPRLVDATGWVARHLETRPSMPILAGVLLETDDDGLVLSGAGDGATARFRVPAAVVNPGRMVVSGRLLAEIVKLLPHHDVELREDGSQLTVRCGSSRASLPVLPVEDYPALPIPPGECGQVAADELVTAATRVAAAASSDQATPQFTVAALDFPAAGEPFRLYATDQFGMAAAEVEWQTIGESTTPDRLLVSAKALDVAARALAADRPGTVRLAAHPQAPVLGLATEYRHITLATLDFPHLPYSRFLQPRDDESEVTVPTAELDNALKRLALHRDAPKARIHCEDNTLSLTVAGNTGSSEEVLAVDYTAAPVTFGMVTARLTNALRTLGTDLAHIVIPGQPNRSWRLSPVADDGTPQTDYRHVVMPAQLVTAEEAA